MNSQDGLLFIDANKYLDLYRTTSGKTLLSALAEQVDHVFVTQQVVNEVRRNMVLVARDFLSDKIKGLKLQTHPVPDHLSGENAEQSVEIADKMSEIAQKVKEANEDALGMAMRIMAQISKGKDEVSLALAPIFARAVPHTAEELQRARERKELGNPPGKGNSIGDGLTWEQILSYLPGKRKLWIISRDDDYSTSYNGIRFLNYFLHDELQERFPGLEVAVFEDITEGIKDFAIATGVKADNLPSPDELQRIKAEEKSLPSLGERKRCQPTFVVRPDLRQEKDWKDDEVVEDMNSGDDMNKDIFVWQVMPSMEEPFDSSSSCFVRSCSDALKYVHELVEEFKEMPPPEDLDDRSITMRLVKMPLFEFINVEGM